MKMLEKHVIFLTGFLFVCFDSLRPINNLPVKQGRVFLGWTSTKLGKICLAQGPQRSDASEARIREPSVSSQALYHRATALLSSLVTNKTVVVHLCGINQGNILIWLQIVDWVVKHQHTHFHRALIRVTLVDDLFRMTRDKIII